MKNNSNIFLQKNMKKFTSLIQNLLREKINALEKTTKRQRQKIIRFVNFNSNTKKLDHYREQLMLYLPWRNELLDLIKINQESIYLKNIKIIESNRKQFIFYSEKYLEQIEEEVNEDYLENKNDEYNVEKDMINNLSNYV